MRLALVGRFLVAIDQYDLEPGARRNIRYPRAHKTGAEHADLAQARRGNVGGPARALLELALRQEQRADHRRGFLRAQYLREIAALDGEREIHRQLQTLVDAGEDRLGGGIIVVGFAAIDRVGGRPDHHPRRREHLARRQLELRIVPGRLGAGIGLHPVLGALDDLARRSDVVDEAHLLGRGGADLVALEQHLQGVRRRHQPRDALRAAAAGEQADLDFRQADARLVAVGDDAVVAGERQLEAAAHADAVDRRGERLARGFQLTKDQRELARAVVEEPHRRLLAFGFGDARVFLAHALQHGQVRAAGEAVLGRSEHRAFDG